MEGTHSSYTQPCGDGTVRDLYFSGMERYSCSERHNAEQLCIHAAFAGCGILTGILIFLISGEKGDAETAAELYFSRRAFTSYADAGEYLSFLASWFSHSLLWLCAALLPALTTHPMLIGRGVCFLRAVTAGFGVCVLSGGFSFFTVFYAALQSGFLALLLMLSVKSVRYAKEKQNRQSRGDKNIRHWLYGAAAPLFTGTLLTFGALLFSMTAVSAAACFFQ